MGDKLGYARYDDLPGHVNPTHDALVGQVAMVLAGQISSMMAGNPKEQGWEKDIQQARAMIQQHLIKAGMNGRFLSTQLDSSGNPILNGEQHMAFAEESDRIIKEGFELAQSQLEKKWPLVRALAGTLLKNGEVSQKRFEELERDFKAGKLPHYETNRVGDEVRRMTDTGETRGFYFKPITLDNLLADCPLDTLAGHRWEGSQPAQGR
jgi:hypothetical protein